MQCSHEEFQGFIGVHRFADTESPEGIRLSVELRVHCEACKAPVRFTLPYGLNLHGAAMSLDGEEARLGAYIGMPTAFPGATGFRVSQEGGEVV